MRRAIRAYLPSFVAIGALVLLAAVVGTYILHNQRLRFPIVQPKPLRLEAVMSNAQAVEPGQGQSVRVAGVSIGQIGQVRLKDGRAVVELDVDHRFKGLVRDDATALLRSKTGLKDMFVEVDPGHGKPLGEGGQIGLSDTLPDVNLDELLSSLDSDTRPYLQLIISGGANGLRGRGRRRVAHAAPAGPAAARRAPRLGRAGRAPPQPAPAGAPLRAADPGPGPQRRRHRAAGAGQQPGVLGLRLRARQPGALHGPAARHPAPDPADAGRRAGLLPPAGPRAHRPAAHRAPAGPRHPRAAAAGPPGHPDRARRAAAAGPGHARPPGPPGSRLERPGQGRPRPDHVAGRGQPAAEHPGLQPGRAPRAWPASPSTSSATARRAISTGRAGWARSAGRCSARPTARACSAASRWATATARSSRGSGCPPP